MSMTVYIGKTHYPFDEIKGRFLKLIQENGPSLALVRNDDPLDEDDRFHIYVSGQNVYMNPLYVNQLANELRIRLSQHMDTFSIANANRLSVIPRTFVGNTWAESYVQFELRFEGKCPYYISSLHTIVKEFILKIPSRKK